jgi:hypothetical protein
MPWPGEYSKATRAAILSINPSWLFLYEMSGFRLRNSLDADQDFLGMAVLRGATISLRKPFSPPQLVIAIDRARGLVSSTGGSMQ